MNACNHKYENSTEQKLFVLNIFYTIFVIEL